MLYFSINFNHRPSYETSIFRENHPNFQIRSRCSNRFPRGDCPRLGGQVRRQTLQGYCSLSHLPSVQGSGNANETLRLWVFIHLVNGEGYWII